MTTRPRLYPLKKGVTSVYSPWWSRVAVMAAVAMSALILTLQVRQTQRVQEAFDGMRDLREAKLDLTKGFLHLKQAGAEGAAYTRSQGLSLVRQGVQRLAKGFEPADGEAGERVRLRAEAFSASLERWSEESPRTEASAAELRTAFYALEREADEADAKLQLRLQELSRRNRQEFLGTTAAAGGLLAVFCVIVMRRQRERIEAERELESREKRFRRVAEGLPQLVWTWTTDGRCDYLSKRWLAYTGRREMEQLGDHWLKAVEAEDRVRFCAATERALASGEAFGMQIRLRRHDDVLRWFDVRVVPLHDEEGEVSEWLGSATDIQLDRELQDAVEKERNFSESMIDSLPGVFYLYDMTGRFLRWNRNFERATGYGPGEIAKMHPLDFFGGEDRARVQARIAEVFEKGISSVEAEFMAKDGTPTPYFFTGIRTEVGDQQCLIGVGIDITERKQAERALSDLNAQLEHRVDQRTAELAAKNRELETFTYSVSHDLKAPLRGIDGYSRLLLEDYGDRLDEDGRRFLTSVRQASSHMGQLIDDLLAYSRLERRTLQPTCVKPQALVAALVNASAGEIETRAVRVTQSVPEELEVRADLQGLTMALRNLIDNALKFTRANAQAEIEIGARIEGDHAVMWVRDNGIGFDTRFMERIFEIFQRLHRSEDYPGTGIGLAIVRKAMERMGGRVWAESSPQCGAVFYLELPLYRHE